MKKRVFVSVLSMAFIMGVCFFFVSCGSDDEGTSGEGKNVPGVIDKNSGLRIKKAEDYAYTYNAKGKLSSISTPYDGMMIFSEDGNTGTMSGYEANIGYNSSGYVTHLNFNADGYNVSVSFSYDGNGHLTNLNQSIPSFTSTTTFYWDNNLLAKVVSIDSEIQYTYEFQYENNQNTNVFGQWGPCFDDFDFRVFYPALAYGGLLGKGPSVLPSGMKEVRVMDGRTKNYSSSYQYKFNSDGTIRSAAKGNRWKDYSYEYYVDAGSTTER